MSEETQNQTPQETEQEELTEVETAPAEDEMAAEEAPQTQKKKEEVDYKSKFFYLAADMDNLKKRFQKEKEGLLKYGNERVLSDLLDVIDNFERTVESLENEENEKIKNIVTGIDMIRKQFLEVLANHGLTVIESIGEAFDPNLHEAVAQEPAETKKEQEVLKEYQKGYLLNGRLLRASKVVVSAQA